jgi:hypothetical protein
MTGRSSSTPPARTGARDWLVFLTAGALWLVLRLLLLLLPLGLAAGLARLALSALRQG